MDFWKELLVLIMTPALAVAAFAWVIQKLFDRSLQRDIERFRSQLEVERFEHQTRFSLIHQRKAEVVSGLYSRLARTKALLGDLVAIFQPAGQNLAEKKKRVSDTYNDASSFFFEHRIFLPGDTSNRVEAMLDLMRSAFYDFDTAQQGNEEYKPDSSGLWIKAYESVRDKLPALLQELEDQFRAALGIIEGKS